MIFAPAQAAAAALTLAWSLAASQPAPSRPISQATAEQLVEQLTPTQPLTRSLARNITPEKRQIDLVINFDFDSAQLQSRSRPLLENLAEALSSARLQELRFRVEGHTDAKGSARYNDELSARRARSVVEFLQGKGVLAQRLEAQGKGFSELLNKDLPEAAENRRVRIITLME